MKVSTACIKNILVKVVVLPFQKVYTCLSAHDVIRFSAATTSTESVAPNSDYDDPNFPGTCTCWFKSCHSQAHDNIYMFFLQLLLVNGKKSFDIYYFSESESLSSGGSVHDESLSESGTYLYEYIHYCQPVTCLYEYINFCFMSRSH